MKTNSSKLLVKTENRNCMYSDRALTGNVYDHRNVFEYKVGDRARHFFGGIDLGSTAFVYRKNDNFIVIKIPGCNSWAGIGLQAYYETYYIVIQYNKKMRSENVWEGYFGKEWRKGLKEIEELIK